MILSLDIETYGISETNWQGRPLPLQRSFHPRRSIATDGVSPADLILLCSLTEVLTSDEPQGEGVFTPALPFRNQRGYISSPCAGTPRTLPDLARWIPGVTRVFPIPELLEWVCEWLKKADTIVGMNIAFDVLNLRAYSPRLALALNGRQRLIDLAVCNFQQSPDRPEKSLKDLGPVLGTYSYSEEIMSGRKEDKHLFKMPGEASHYNGEDSHNAILGISALAQRTNHPDKLSPDCLSFYSDSLWNVIRMSEAGIPFSDAYLRMLETECLDTVKRTRAATESYVLPTDPPTKMLLAGKGSDTAKRNFMQHCFEEAEVHSGEDLFSHSLAMYTPKLKRLSFDWQNQALAKSHLPSDHPVLAPLNALDEHTYAWKVYSTYVHKLLHSHIKDPDNKQDIVIDGIAYTNWAIVPTHWKDGTGGTAGTKQGRIICKNPAAQTFPPPVIACIVSRYRDGFIVVYDLSQIEIRVAGLLSGESTILSEYLLPKPDLHAKRAILIDPTWETYPGWRSGDTRTDPRQWGKHVNFADLFRAGALRLQHLLLELTGRVFPYDFCLGIVASRPYLRPGLWDWQEHLIAHCRKHGSLILPITGQSRTFSGGEEYDVNEICNFPVQTVAGNVMLYIQAEINRLLPPPTSPSPLALPFLNQYDSMWFDTRHPAELDALVQRAVKTVAESGYWARLQDYTGNVVPLVLERKVLTPHAPTLQSN